MQKLCTKCGLTKPLTDFGRRAASRDGINPVCLCCLRRYKWVIYWADPAERTKASLRVGAARQRRYRADPAYKRAFNLWGSTRKRTKIPRVMKITDFVPICREALRMGPSYELDHIVPLKHPLVCGLHVPWNIRVVPTPVNQAKQNHFAPT